MLFNSYEFLLLFLPIALAGFFAIGALSRHRFAVFWLFAASLFFYGWWNPRYVALLILSICFNFAAGRALISWRSSSDERRKKGLLVSAIAVNLAVLGYFKYANFFLSNISELVAAQWNVAKIILPLGISFFTFTQIAFLVDAYRGKVQAADFGHYGLFVTFFPHLIAGPILHHAEIMPQFGRPETFRPNYEMMAVGLSVFSIGLFKKVMLADGIAQFVAPVFNKTHVYYTTAPSFLEAWGGAAAYTLQLYFDFSGYSDMAIGLALMFGIRFPLNFDSPYKARNIIEFWRRWHMTLSRFLRDYLYIPLGGNKKGGSRRYLNLMITMLLGGLWHGAGWTFVLWGALHGLYLVVNHAWIAFKEWALPSGFRAGIAGTLLSRALTFAAVVVAWVFFRADSVPDALLILRGMAGFNGVVLPISWQGKLGQAVPMLDAMGISFRTMNAFSGGLQIYWVAALLAIVWALPNTQQIVFRHLPVLDPVVRPAGWANRLFWTPSWLWALIVCALSITSLLNLSRPSEFIYFQF